MKNRIQQLVDSWKLFRTMPEIQVHLHSEKVDEANIFYRKVTEDFYYQANRRHRKFPLVKNMVHGVALSDISQGFESYLAAIESSAKRNYKKALRNGFSSRPIDYNDHLNEIWSIRRSTPVRQGELPDEFLNTPPKKRVDPVSIDKTHDYRYFGVFNQEGMLVAYAGCLSAGELMMIEHIYGHSEYQSFGVVPMLMISMAKHAEEDHSSVRYYAYGTFFGASDTMRRFKKKFLFLPHKVNWVI